jgi:hypothetical protein
MIDHLMIRIAAYTVIGIALLLFYGEIISSVVFIKKRRKKRWMLLEVL